jgi:hypothetical protein
MLPKALHPERPEAALAKRLGVGAIVLLLAGIVAAALLAPGWWPHRQAPKPDPTVAALIERVHALEEKQQALELRAWKLESDAMGLRADVAALSGRVVMIEKVVPVEAIRDRARQR